MIKNVPRSPRFMMMSTVLKSLLWCQWRAGRANAIPSSWLPPEPGPKPPCTKCYCSVIIRVLFNMPKSAASFPWTFSTLLLWHSKTTILLVVSLEISRIILTHLFSSLPALSVQCHGLQKSLICLVRALALLCLVCRPSSIPINIASRLASKSNHSTFFFEL